VNHDFCIGSRRSKNIASISNVAETIGEGEAMEPQECIARSPVRASQLQWQRETSSRPGPQSMPRRIALTPKAFRHTDDHRGNARLRVNVMAGIPVCRRDPVPLTIENLNGDPVVPRT